MTEEELTTSPVGSPTTADTQNKRKLEHVDEATNQHPNSEPNFGTVSVDDEAAQCEDNGGAVGSQSKRPRLENNGDTDGPVSHYEYREEEKEGEIKSKESEHPGDENDQSVDGLESVKEQLDTITVEPNSGESENPEIVITEELQLKNSEEEEPSEERPREGDVPVPATEQNTGSDTQILSRKMEIPSIKAMASISASKEADIQAARLRMCEKKAEIGLSWHPKLDFFSSTKRCKRSVDEVEGRALCEPNPELVDGLFLPPNDPRKLNKLLKKQVKDTVGKNWFDMPAQTITPELKKDLQLLKMRSAIDPKRHYKKGDSRSKTLPKYFQVGTVIESASEFFTGRLTKKERKATLADELLFDGTFHEYRKRKVREIEEENQPAGVDKWKMSRFRNNAKARKSNGKKKSH